MAQSNPKYASLTDENLLANYRANDDLIYLGELYQRHSEMVYYVCLRYFQDSENSKDAVMQIFEELIRKVNKQEINDFPRWLYVVAKNFCLMQLRSKKNISTTSLDEFVKFPYDLHPSENSEEKEEQLTAMEQCLDKLPEKQKASIDLFFLQEKCYQDISMETGYSMKEVKSFIQNGKRNLKICMEKQDEQR